MIFRSESPEARVNRLAQWHRWFAWRPVRVSDHCIAWLEFVWRRGEWWCVDAWGSWFEWEYREIEK